MNIVTCHTSHFLPYFAHMVYAFPVGIYCIQWVCTIFCPQRQPWK